MAIALAYPFVILPLIAIKPPKKNGGSNENETTRFAIAILQSALVVPVTLFLSGLILFFNGWRLDPILLVAYVLMLALVLFLTLKDVLLRLLQD